MDLKRVIYVCNFAANYGGNFLSSLYNVANKLSEKQSLREGYQPFGDGHSAIKIVRAMEKWWEENR